ncbi:MAG: hypothetical protein KY434_03720 [Actinobacteria bacterium]|nr:hypothetical protein [Actinomycetota bacterium]
MEAAVLGHLDALGASYEVVRIDPRDADTAAFCARYGYAEHESGNCILVGARSDPRRYAACLVQATRRVDVNRTVRRLLGARKVSFASAEEATAVTGMLPGGVTPFGLPDEVTLYVDAPVAALRRVVVGAGSRALKVEVDGVVFARMPGATVVRGLGAPPPA